MKKRLLAGLMAGLMALSLTACGGSGESDEAKDGKIKLVVPVIGYTKEKIEAAKKTQKEDSERLGKDVPLSEEARVSMMLMDTVKEKYPDYDVSWEDWGWAESLDQKQRSNLTAGTQVDILAGETFMPTYANEGVLEPLPQDIIDLCHPSMLLYGADGKAYGVHDKSSPFLLFYNKDLLAKAGLDPETPPKTWDEFEEMSAQITKAGKGEFWGGGVPTFPHAGGALRATPFFRMNKTDFALDGKSNLSDPALQEVLEFIRKMDKNFPKGLGNGADEGPLWNAFEKDQTIAFAVNGSWGGVNCERNGMNWGVAPLPTKDGTDGNCLVGSVIMGVSAKSKHKEEAFNIIRCALNEERLKIWTEADVVVPLKSIIEDEAFYKDKPVLKTAMDSIKNSQMTGLAVFNKNDSQVWEIIDQQVLARTTMTNDKISTICKDAEEQIKPLLK